jgi:rod shape-determining protein MreD
LKHIIIGIILIVVYALQLTLVSELRIFGIQANLLLVVTCAISFLFGSVDGSIVGIVLGLLLDLYQGRNIGLSALVFFYLAIFIGSFNKKFFKDNYLILLILTIVATVIYETIMYVFAIFAYSQSFMILSLIRNLMIGVGMNVITGAIIYPFLLKINIGFEAHRNIFR